MGLRDGHPGEVFLVENRGEVDFAKYQYDTVPAGLYIYHVNSKAPTNGAPLIDLVNMPAKCPGKLVPFQGTFSPGSTPAANFHDGKSAGFEIKSLRRADTLQVTVSFGQ